MTFKVSKFVHNMDTGHCSRAVAGQYSHQIHSTVVIGHAVAHSCRNSSRWSLPQVLTALVPFPLPGSLLVPHYSGQYRDEQMMVGHDDCQEENRSEGLERDLVMQDHFVQFFPGASKNYKGRKTFMDNFDDDLHAAKCQDNLYYPFALVGDWPMAEWIELLGLSMAQMGKFLSMQFIFDSAEKIHWVYHDWLTGDCAWELQDFSDFLRNSQFISFPDSQKWALLRSVKQVAQIVRKVRFYCPAWPVVTNLLAVTNGINIWAVNFDVWDTQEEACMAVEPSQLYTDVGKEGGWGEVKKMCMQAACV
ncbi:hypothetical protein EDC04DRAFT_2598443 [Pisolithus marmoratus]|nr:hypothetical protein EDC04DRAFT_2598443 [Pisolithus marmoratus]